MSAGPFLIAVYTATYGGGANLHPIRIQPETLTAAAGSAINSQSDSDATSPISAQVSQSRRGLGLHARMVNLRLATGSTPPAGGYTAASTTRIPALNQAFYDACAIPGATVSYLGTVWRVTGVLAEKTR